MLFISLEGVHSEGEKKEKKMKRIQARHGGYDLEIKIESTICYTVKKCCKIKNEK